MVVHILNHLGNKQKTVLISSHVFSLDLSTLLEKYYYNTKIYLKYWDNTYELI